MSRMGFWGTDRGVHTPFYAFGWLSRWSRRKSRADRRKARTRLQRHDRYTRHEVTAPRAGGSSGRTNALNLIEVFGGGFVVLGRIDGG